MPVQKNRLLAILGPGILVAATGVGAGDLATGAFTGNKLGMAVLWVVIVGAALKFVLNEGLARWQLATGHTLLEGAVMHLGRPVQWIFAIYLCIWSFLVGLALMSACGVTFHAMVSPSCDAETDKILYGILHSALAVGLVRWGGYRLFERVMSACIAIMFIVVVVTAVALKPPLNEIVAGLFIPSIPNIGGEGLDWTIALLGGVGGTVTVLCYGYWIREKGRQGVEELKLCRIDLATAYLMTALFGLSMVVVGSQIGNVKGGGSGLIVQLANELESALAPLGTQAKWAFLVGAWGAVFSSLLGVWQSLPYLFTDFWYLMQDPQNTTGRRTIDTQSKPYKGYLLTIASVPAVGLWWLDFETAQKMYAIVGALFIPMLALVLLILNGQTRLVGQQFRNSRFNSALLIATLAIFLVAGWFGIQNKFFG